MELKTYFAILSRRWWIVLLMVVIIGGAFIYDSRWIPPTYQAETNLRITTPLGGTLTDVSYQTYYANRLMNTYLEIATSEQMMANLKAKLGVTSLPDISVKLTPDSEIIQILVKSSNPELAAATANLLANEVINSSQASASQGGVGSENINILIDRQNSIQQELDQANQDYQALVNNYASTAAQLSALESTISLKEDLYKNLVTQKQAVMVAPPTPVPTPRVGATPVATTSPIEIIDREISQAESELAYLKSQAQGLSTSAAQYSERLLAVRQTIQNKQTSLASVQSQIDATRIANLKMQSAQEVSIISLALPPTQPTGPGRWLIIGLGVLCGLIGGVVVAFVVDNLDNSIQSAQQLQALTTLPVLGSLPSLSKRDALLPLGSKDNRVQRACWSLCTRAILLEQSRPMHTLLFTSPNPAEGKSTVLFTMAQGLAKAKHRVLVIDADLRKPRQHSLWHTSNTRGLTNVLQGEEGVREVIQEIEPAGVFFLPSGPEFNDPATLLESKNFSTLLESLSDYEFILIDTPALLAVPDTFSLARHADGIILVVQEKRTTTDELQAALDQLEDVKSRLVGVVVNRASSLHASGYYQQKSPDSLRSPFHKVQSEQLYLTQKTTETK